jgi:hypothetical protein
MSPRLIERLFQCRNVLSIGRLGNLWVNRLALDQAALQTKKTARRRAFPPWDGRYAVMSAVSCLRREAMKPMPAKPRIIIAHVEGSGTAALTPCSTNRVNPWDTLREVLWRLKTTFGA